MSYNNIYKNCKPVILNAFLLIAIGQNFILAQTQRVEIKGYDKASYNASHVGKFMQTWLVAGPFSISNDTLQPDDALQEKVFKTDLFISLLISF